MWAASGNLNTARWIHTATLLQNGQVLVAGGYGSNNVVLDSAELYDPVTGRWSRTIDMNNARYYHTATLMQSGQVLVAGGNHGDVTVLDSAELSNPASGMWAATANMFVGRYQHTATLLPNGQVLVAGGLQVSAASASKRHRIIRSKWALGDHRQFETGAVCSCGHAVEQRSSACLRRARR